MTGARDKERGAALITAILLVALMSGLALGIATDMRFSLRRASNLDARDQAYWYALGARDYSEALLLRALNEPEQVFRPNADWLGTPRIFPIEGGQLAGEVRDGHNCFNLNALVAVTGDAASGADATQQRRFVRLMEELGIATAQASRIAASAADWIDSDSRPVTSGGEDEIYLRAGRDYRTANVPMAEARELRSVAGVTPDIYARIAPFLCAFPARSPVALDINTLRLDQVPLLVAAFDGALTRAQAETVLLQRPAAGYADIGAFWTSELIAALQLDAAERPEIGVSSHRFEIDIAVDYAGVRYRLLEQVETGSSQRVVRLAQRHGIY
ncbi:type II secretion system minor pseudopilin GspK [Maricaulis sp.]|uniref:type II secretion system minor pseudopilin GspK n=1 Tax=Maricaulis sp. TaxID=1486257 RepID=UPI003A8D006F